MDKIKPEAEKIPWQTRWAKNALVYSLVAWGLLIVSPFAFAGIFITLPASFIFCVVSLIISVVVLIGIWHKKGSVKDTVKATAGLLCSLLLIIVFGTLPYILTLPRYIAGKAACKEHLITLKKALTKYSTHYGQYPPADKWCDLLIEYSGIHGVYFACPAAREKNYHRTIDQKADPNSPWFQIFSYTDPNGRDHYVKRGYYAINPNCEPNSPNDTVLLFETKGGWNQFGGPDILTIEHHRRNGCNVLFNDGHVEFIKPNHIGQLKWNAK